MLRAMDTPFIVSPEGFRQDILQCFELLKAEYGRNFDSKQASQVVAKVHRISAEEAEAYLQGASLREGISVKELRALHLVEDFDRLIGERIYTSITVSQIVGAKYRMRSSSAYMAWWKQKNKE